MIFSWLLSPARIGFAPLFAVLIGAELFNLTQAGGFWWSTMDDDGGKRPGGRAWHQPSVEGQ